MSAASVHDRRLRRIAKFPLFLLRGLSWRKALWLARTDAARRGNFHAVTLPDLKAAWAAAGTWPDLAVQDGRIISRALRLPLGAGSLAAAGYATLRLIQRRGFELATQGDGIAARGNGLTVRFVHPEEMETFREIFLEGSYDIRPAGHWLVLDVGANVGFASLFFAGQPWADRVMAFEPFAPTAAAFAANLALNPVRAEKIALQPFGWSDRDAGPTVDYSRAYSGRMRTDGVDSLGCGPAVDRIRTPIQLRRAATVFAALAAESGGRRIFLKLDCEGSEYSILRDLDEADLLRRVDLLAMEWHDRPPDELVARLQRAGFTVQVRPVKESEKQGMVVAWRLGGNP